MHIEKIKYYLDLYDCRSFTETAKKNFISQASISQYITSLEKEFRAQFFDRTVTPIRPTQAGNLFYNKAKLLLKQYEETKEELVNLAQMAVPKLTLAYTSLNDLKLLLPFVFFLKGEKIGLEIELEKVDCKDIESYIVKGICDFGLSFADEFSNSNLDLFTVKSGNYKALLAQGHPLFKNNTISVEELYRYPLLMLSEESMGESFLTMKERSLEDGYFPNIARTVDDFEEGFFYILTEQLIGFATEDYDLENLDGIIRSVPINRSSHSYKIVLAYQKETENQILLRLLSLLQTYLS